MKHTKPHLLDAETQRLSDAALDRVYWLPGPKLTPKERSELVYRGLFFVAGIIYALAFVRF